MHMLRKFFRWKGNGPSQDPWDLSTTLLNPRGTPKPGQSGTVETRPVRGTRSGR